MNRLAANPSLYAPRRQGQAFTTLAAGVGLWAAALGVPALWFGLPSAWPAAASVAVVLAPLGVLAVGVKTRRRDLLLGAFPVAVATCALVDPRWTALPGTGLPAASAFGLAALAYLLTVRGTRWTHAERRRVASAYRPRHAGSLLSAAAGAFAGVSTLLGLWVGLGDGHAALIDEAWGPRAPLGSVLCVWLGLGAAVAALAGTAHRFLVGRPVDGAATLHELNWRHSQRTRRAPSRLSLGMIVALLGGLGWWHWHGGAP